MGSPCTSKKPVSERIFATSISCSLFIRTFNVSIVSGYSNPLIKLALI
jgi:hypothetical protein